MSNGLKFDRDGNMIAALGADYGGQMLIKTDMKSGKSYILTGLYEGTLVGLLYHTTDAYNPAAPDEERIPYNDPAIGFDWTTQMK